MTKVETINFRGTQIYVQKDPRCDDCNGCRTVLGEINAQTGKLYYSQIYLGRRFALHHELYDFTDVLAYTSELCPICHAKYNREQKILGADNITRFFINYSEKENYTNKRKWKQRPLIILPGCVV